MTQGSPSRFGPGADISGRARPSQRTAVLGEGLVYGIAPAHILQGALLEEMVAVRTVDAGYLGRSAGYFMPETRGPAGYSRADRRAPSYARQDEQWSMQDLKGLYSPN